MSDLPLPQENAHARTKVLRIQAENARLKAEVQTLRHQAVHDVSQLGEQSAEIAHLKAEVERLTALVESNLNCSKITMGKSDAVLHERDNFKAENEELHKDYEALADEHTKLIDKNARLKADFDLMHSSKLVYFIHGEGRWANFVEENTRLNAEVERLQKLVGMQESIDKSIDAWIESKYSAKEGKPSV